MSARQMSNRQNLIGVWLYFESATHEKVSAYLRDWQPSPYWGQIQGVRVNPTVVSRIVPQELQEGAESWLVLYRTNLPQELLVLPFPESGNAFILNEPENFGGYLSSLLEYVQGDNHSWYPYNGFRNLIEYININRKTTYPFSQPSPPQRFQVVRHYKPIAKLLEKLELRYYDEKQRETVTVFTRASQRIQQNRDHLLASLVTAQNEEQIRELLENFEMALLEEGDRLSELVEREVPTIIDKFESVMDEETKIFLVSSEAVARFARRQLSDDFDFSLCGCGLWKAVERELNSSIVWHLRLTKGIADKNRAPTPETSPKTSVNYEAGSETLNINRRERGSSEFEGITLGRFEYLLRSAHDNHIAEEIESALTEEMELLRFALESGKGGLAHFIRQVAAIRNGHAHIKAMKESSYQDLRLLVLEPSNRPDESPLGRILETKRAIANYWHRR